jgi:hypothetical protein
LDSQSLQASARFESLDRQTRAILATILEQSSNTSKNVTNELQEMIGTLTVTITQLLSRSQHINQQDHSRTRDVIARMICERKENQDIFLSVDRIASGIEMLHVSDASEQEATNLNTNEHDR